MSGLFMGRGERAMDTPKAILHRYLRVGTDALVWKLEGLSERDIRRPLVPSGTNLLGLVKHYANVEAGYLGEVFDRPFPEELAWTSMDAEPNADMYATADESRDDILGLLGRVMAHGDATIAALDLDAPGEVPWWGPGAGPVTLQRILVHLATEAHRHAGHADIVRELIDGDIGHRPGVSNLPDLDAADWADHRARLQQIADDA